MPPKVTEETSMKFVPEMVTLVPPVTLPLNGLRLMMVGAGAMTWMVKKVLDELLLRSELEQTTVVIPIGKTVPLGGKQVTGRGPSTVSMAVGFV